MQFTKLRLIGFKSFVEPQEFVIERGLTGVVGPNGCGKSNLVEALRWVMGENSYKNMRASGMDDVIFSGSNTRPPRNAAEVILFLNNSDHSAPPAFNDEEELQVSRRLERASGSAYRINGKDVRAKDVQLLFADQSTGARSPSMVGQGRIGELIQAKPQARRALLEEAAGISGLHSRRHEAELRLKAAETNLNRLQDVVGDLSGRIESLKRQARQANRFKGLSADIRGVEAGLFYLRWAEAKTIVAETETHLTAATLKVAENAQMHLNAERARDHARDMLPPLREMAAKAASSHQHLRITLRQMEDEARRRDERRSELLRRLEQLQQDIERESALMLENTEFLARLEKEEVALLALNKDVHEEETLNMHFKTTGEMLSASEKALSLEAEKRSAAMLEINQFKQLHDEAKNRSNRLAEQFSAVEQELLSLAAAIAALGDAFVMHACVKDAEAAMANALDVAQQAEIKVSKTRLHEQTLRAPVSEARRLLSELQAEARTLEKIIHSVSSDYPVAVDEINVDNGYETALGAALGDDLEAALDNAAPLFWRVLPFSDHDPDLPEGVLSLERYVRAPQVLLRRLKQVGIVREEEGDELQKSLKPGQALVSRQGALWRWDGITARANAPTASAQRLAQKNRLSELKKLIEAAEVAANEAETALQNSEALRIQAEEADKAARAHVHFARDAQEKARNAVNDLERRSGEFLSRKKSLEERGHELNAERKDYAVRLANLEEKLATAPDVTAIENEISRLTIDVNEKRSVVMQARSALDGFRREKDARAERHKRIIEERANWKVRLDNARRQIAVLEERRGQLMEEEKNIAVSPEDVEEKKTLLLSEIEKAQERHKMTSDEVAGAEQKQALLDKTLTEAFAVLSSAREERARAEERVHAAINRCRELEIRIGEALNCTPFETMKLAGFTASNTLPEISVLEHQLERLRIERERLGAVNLRAEEEEQELRERYDTMTIERDDVVEAIKKLRHAIQGLNHEGRERLLVAFEKVNNEFQRLFTHLFGGGTAELQLIESDDPLDAGLEILARPPGKKPQTMTLLSGGEQALTALALIFAVFLTNPAPICVLDEVDAPLDDHNVERYCNLLEEMSRSTLTRFVVITHNPITMARMNRLFGVTMAEQGVSQLVSVDLQMAEQLRESA